MKKILFSIFALAMALTVNAQTPREELKITLSLDKALVGGGEAVLTVNESDESLKYAGFKMTPVLPEGVKVKYDEDDEDYVYSIEPARLNGHSITFGKNFVAYGAKVFKTVAGNDALLHVTLVADASFKSGVISMNNIEFSDKDGNVYTTQSASINSDGTTGAKIVTSDSANEVSKTVEKNQVVIKKNGKKWNAAGGQIK